MAGKTRPLALVRVLAALAAALTGGPALAQSFTPGNLIVLRVGDGVAAPSAVGTQGALLQFAPTGGGQSPSVAFALPTGSAGVPSNRIVFNGTGNTEGQITLSGNQVVVTGYDANLGAGSVAASSAVPRTAGVVNVGGPAAYATVFTGATGNTANGYSGAAFRSAALSGASLYGAGSNGGTQLFDVTNPAAVPQAATVIQDGVANTRMVGVQNNTLFFTVNTGPSRGLYQAGSTGTLPTGNVNATTARIAPMSSTSSPGAFAMSPDGLTLFLADDRTDGNGGVYKFTRANTGVNFTQARRYTVGNSLGALGLAVDFSDAGSGTYRVYVTTSNSDSFYANNSLLHFDETSAVTGSAVDATGLGSFETLAFAGNNQVFHGVVLPLAPVPEPTTVVAVGAAGLLAAATARRRRSAG